MLVVYVSIRIFFFFFFFFFCGGGGGGGKQYFIYQIQHKYINLQFYVFQDLAVSLELISAIS